MLIFHTSSDFGQFFTTQSPHRKEELCYEIEQPISSAKIKSALPHLKVRTRPGHKPRQLQIPISPSESAFELENNRYIITLKLCLLLTHIIIRNGLKLVVKSNNLIFFRQHRRQSASNKSGSACDKLFFIL